MTKELADNAETFNPGTSSTVGIICEPGMTKELADNAETGVVCALSR
jgi:hypothetical protein